MKFVRRFSVLLCALSAIYMPLGAQAQLDENSVKAMWVYTLIPYVTWPDSPNNITICTRGLDGVYDAMLEIKEQKNFPQKIKEIGTQGIDKDCQVLYIADSEASNLASILKQSKDKPVLTVSNIYDFAKRYGMVEFTRSGNGVKLKINISTAKQSGLTINSDLLGVSEVVN